jgi:hypothetical protein
MALSAGYVTGYLPLFITICCAKHRLDKKPLSITYNVPGHPVNVEDYKDNICLLTPYPSLHGVIAAFKACYLQLIMRYLVSGSVGESKPII